MYKEKSETSIRYAVKHGVSLFPVACRSVPGLDGIFPHPRLFLINNGIFFSFFKTEKSMLLYIGCGKCGKKTGSEFGQFVFHFRV